MHTRHTANHESPAVPNAHVLMVAVALFPAVVTAVLTWFALRKTEAELSELDDLRGMHFED